MCIDENEDELLIIEYSSVISWLIHTNSLVNICLRLTCPSTPQSSTFILAKVLTTPDVVADLGGLETILLSHNPRCITVSMPDVKLNRANLLARKIVGAFPQVTQAGLLRLSSNSTSHHLCVPRSGHDAVVFALAISADGLYAASLCLFDGPTLILWSILDGASVGEWDWSYSSSVFSPDSRLLAASIRSDVLVYKV
ncbi:hypothetical protein C8Q76DRAFT_685240, partial [Earliella scabrosa]